MRAMKTVGPGMKETHPLVGTMARPPLQDASPASTRSRCDGCLTTLRSKPAPASAPGVETPTTSRRLSFRRHGRTHGVTAALAVHSGWTGVDDVLSGPNNFVESYNPKADPAGMSDKLGEVYGVTLTTLKSGPPEAPSRPRSTRCKSAEAPTVPSGSSKQVVVRVATSAGYTVNIATCPTSACTPGRRHAARQTVSFRAAHDKPRMKDPSVLQQRAKVQLAPDEEFENSSRYAWPS